ncbi:MAG: hypothetical protein ABI218_01830 [Caldimonas sp.]
MSKAKEHGSAGSKVTPWLGGDVSPVRAGVYERRAPAGPYACWDGSRWRADASRPDDASRETNPSRFDRAAWRGLAEPSAAPCATCRGHGVVDRGIDVESGADLIEECPDC